MKKEITHLDCFAGPGGFSTGFRAAGIKTLAAIEWVESCAETFAANHPNVEVFNKDIRDVGEAELNKFKGKIDFISAGMPCETFSTAGSKSRSSYDHRQTLFREAIRIAKLVDAQAILFENVPGITTKKLEKGGDKLVVDLIFDSLSEAGYKYYVDTILDASDFGVPQNRKRFFIFASKKKLPLRTPVVKHNGRITVQDAIADLPIIHANEEDKSRLYRDMNSEYSKIMKDNDFWKLPRKVNGHPSYHIPPNHRPATIERFKRIEQGEGLKDLFMKFKPEEVEKLQEQKILPKKWYIQRNRRLIPTLPSVTVTSHCLDELVHPEYDRALTVREVARLQSFPDGYDFLGGPLICPHIYHTQDKYEQVGDAVPPLVAYHWGKVVKEVLESDENS